MTRREEPRSCARLATDELVALSSAHLSKLAHLIALYEHGADIAAAWGAAGGEIIVREDDLVSTLYKGDATMRLLPPSATRAVGTTRAGDNFVVESLATRPGGASIDDALNNARALAADVVQTLGQSLSATKGPRLVLLFRDVAFQLRSEACRVFSERIVSWSY